VADNKAETLMRENWLGFTVHVHHKGGNSQAEMNRANNISDQQLALMQKQLGMVDPSLQKIIAAGGMLPGTQSAMTSIAMNSLPAQYQNLTGQLSNQLVQRGVTGGGMAGGGDIARTFGALGSAEANQQSNLLSNIQLEKAQGLNQALGMGLGLTGMFNQGGVNALGIGQQAAGQADASQSAFWGSLFGGLGALGGGLATGIGAAKGCWVAAELYGGWFASETCAIRNWLWATWWMRPFCLVYMKFGQRWAKLIRRSVSARRLTKWLFDWFLVRANG
jgi:hypothetical protein